MNIIVLDGETTVQWIEEVDEDGKKKTVIDNSPYNPENKLVSVNWRKIENGVIGEDNHSIYFHNEYPQSDPREPLQEALDWADMVVAHNAKYDMIGEYVLARGTYQPLSLKETAIRRNVTHKKSDLTEEYWNKGVGFEAMPLPVVMEYADADVLSCAEIFIEQQKDWEKPENASLNNIVELMNDMLEFIVEIEHNGIKIDTDRLAEVEAEFRAELVELENDLNEIARSVMGDTPFSLTSGPDISKIVFSREVVHPITHKLQFNLGLDKWGRKQYPPYMTDRQFNDAVRKTTRIIKKTSASSCERCQGTGKIRHFKKNGEPYKNMNACKTCEGTGYILTDTNQVAGLKLVPEVPADASVHGFSVSKENLDRLIDQAERRGKLNAVEFLKKKKRLNAVNVYLNSFVEGMKRWTRKNNLLHAGFNQTTTKTGRLSSSSPKLGLSNCVNSVEPHAYVRG